MHIHDDTMAWTNCPHYTHFVRGTHRSPVGSLHKRPLMWSINIFLLLACMHILYDKLKKRYHSNVDVHSYRCPFQSQYYRHILYWSSIPEVLLRLTGPTASRNATAS